VLTFMGGTSPYNNRFELSAGGRHRPCLRKAGAGSPPAAGLPASASRPSSQLNRALYGPKKSEEVKTKKNSTDLDSKGRL
jgi:hypothetical protein